MDNLPELRDIHLPTDGVSFFPLAYGWWGLLLLIVLLLVGIKVFFWLRKTSKKVYAFYLLRKTMSDNSPAAAVQMSELLRRICVSRYPEAVALNGAEWIGFLNGKSKEKLNLKTADLLQNAPYIPETSKAYSEDDVMDLRQFCRRWIGENL